jgi:hypothetical protein
MGAHTKHLTPERFDDKTRADRPSMHLAFMSHGIKDHKLFDMAGFVKRVEGLDL